MHQSYRMIAKTLQALEPVLAQELIALGAEEVEEGRRMVSFRGDRALLYRANYQLRTALRVLLPLASFRARTPDELYEALRRLDWRQWMRPTDTFAFDAVVYSDTFTHSRYVGYRAKDALVDYFMEQEGTRPGVRLDNPDLRFHIHIAQEEVTLALDSSGESLHKRGWRAAQTEAPMSEVLAAGILRLAGWEGQCDFIDPMCGSGTLLIEAALIARGIAPGSYGRSFAFQRWHDYDAELFRQIQEEAKAQQRHFDHHIYGSDVAISAVQIARHNVRLAGLEEVIHVEHRALEDCPSPIEPALLVTNPPYGERLRLREGDALYSMIGERLKHNYPGCTAWIITDKAEHFAKIGLRPSARYQLLNGALECELRGYELFAGKKAEQQAEDGEERRTPRIERRERRPRPAGERRERRFDGDKPRRAFDGERRERRFDGDKPRRAFDGERRERRFDGDKSRCAFDGERRERRFDGDQPRRAFDGERRERRFDGDQPRRAFDGERRERRFDGDKPRRAFDGERRERRFDGDQPRRAFDGERRERRFDGDKPRRAFDGERRERRFDEDKPRRAFDGERRERRFDGDKPRRPEGQLWPNDRFRYRDEAGRERLRSKRPTRLQHFSADEED